MDIIREDAHVHPEIVKNSLSENEKFSAIIVEIISRSKEIATIFEGVSDKIKEKKGAFGFSKGYNLLTVRQLSLYLKKGNHSLKLSDISEWLNFACATGDLKLSTVNGEEFYSLVKNEVYKNRLLKEYLEVAEKALSSAAYNYEIAKRLLQKSNEENQF